MTQFEVCMCCCEVCLFLRVVDLPGTVFGVLRDGSLGEVGASAYH